jgi:hypothetical protein
MADVAFASNRFASGLACAIDVRFAAATGEAFVGPKSYSCGAMRCGATVYRAERFRVTLPRSPPDWGCEHQFETLSRVLRRTL